MPETGVPASNACMKLSSPTPIYARTVGVRGMRSLSGALVLSLLLAFCSGCDSNSQSSSDSLPLVEGPQPFTGYISAQANPFRLLLHVDGGILVQQCGPIQLTRLDGSVDDLVMLVKESAVTGGSRFDVTTQSGEEATLVVSTTDNASFRIAVASTPVAAVSVGLCLKSGEAIYGLTERLRDSAILNPALHGPLLEDFSPDAVSTLNRRGEKVEMFVRPTISLYAPFYHSPEDTVYGSKALIQVCSM